jgi:hypothetical protein
VPRAQQTVLKNQRLLAQTRECEKAAQVQRFLSCAVGASAVDAERSLMSAATAATGTFAVGDVVVVTSGDLKNLKGEVVEVDGTADRVFVLPKGLAGFSEKLDFKRGELQKFIAVGARVRVCSLFSCDKFGTSCRCTCSCHADPSL